MQIPRLDWLRTYEKGNVTIVVGDAYTALWRSKALPSWERFARRHGYELVLFDHLLDESAAGRERSPSWQKLLILHQPQVQPFERVLWLDADIIINDVAAPCPIEATPESRVGMVMDQALAFGPAMASTFKRINGNFAGTPGELAPWVYSQNGLAAPCDYLLNGGVMALSHAHDPILQHVYRSYRQSPTSNYEQTALSYELLTRGLQHLLDPRFNLLWLERQALMAPFSYWTPSGKLISMAFALADCYFLHFARHLDDMRLFDAGLIIGQDGGVSLPLEIAYRFSGEWRSLAEDLAKPH